MAIRAGTVASMFDIEQKTIGKTTYTGAVGAWACLALYGKAQCMHFLALAARQVAAPMIPSRVSAFSIFSAPLSPPASASISDQRARQSADRTHFDCRLLICPENLVEVEEYEGGWS